MSQKLKSITIDGQRFEIGGEAAATPDYNPIYVGRNTDGNFFFELEGINVPSGITADYQIKVNESTTGENRYGFQIILVPTTTFLDDGAIVFRFNDGVASSDNEAYLYGGVANIGAVVRKTIGGSNYAVLFSGNETFQEITWNTNPPIANGQVLEINSAYVYDIYIVYSKQ
jgi:hypothetical protein